MTVCFNVNYMPSRHRHNYFVSRAFAYGVPKFLFSFIDYIRADVSVCY